MLLSFYHLSKKWLSSQKMVISDTARLFQIFFMYLCEGIAMILYFFVIFPRVWYIFRKNKKAPTRASFIHIFHGVPHLTGQPTGFFAAWLRLLSVLSTQGLEPRCNCRNRPRTKCIGFRGGGESNPRYTNARYSPSSYHIRKKL